MTKPSDSKARAWQKFNWSEDKGRTSRLSALECGVLYQVRAELWMEDEVLLSRDILIKRLRLRKPEAQALDTLFTMGLLRMGTDNLVFDPEQRIALSQIIRKSEINTKNRQGKQSQHNAPENSPKCLLDKDLGESVGNDPSDF